MMVEALEVRTTHRGLHEITRDVGHIVARSEASEGLCTVFIRHTSASLLIQENADPTARRDLESWFDRLAPDHDPLYTHTVEGPDDMPAHIKSALTATSLGIPIVGGSLALGSWQGIYLWEHRDGSHTRKILVHVG